MDGVGVDFIGGVSKFHHCPIPGHPHKPEEQTDQTPWEIDEVMGLSPHALWSPLGRTFWANLKALPHFTSLLLTLEERFGEKNICLLTSPPMTDGSIDGKRDWIKKHMNRYRRRFLVGPAKEFCAAPDHLLIDDNETNIEKFEEAGGQTFLFPAPWNYRFKEDPMTALHTFLEELEC